MEIKKLGYSAKPWRLLTSDGCEVRAPMDFDHPVSGKTRILESVSGNTRKECEEMALTLLERLLFAPSATVIDAVMRESWNAAISEAVALVRANFDECEPWITPEQIEALKK